MRHNVTSQFDTFRGPILDTDLDGPVYGSLIVPISDGLSVLGANVSDYPESRLLHFKSSIDRTSGLITSMMALSIDVDGIRLAEDEGLPEEDITFDEPINAWSLRSVPDETMLCFGRGLYEYTHIVPHMPAVETAPTKDITLQQIERIVGRILGPHIASTFTTDTTT